MKPEQIRDVYYKIFPTAKDLITQNGDMSLYELFESPLHHKVDREAYPHVDVHLECLREQVAQTHNMETADKVMQQMETSFIANEMVHLSFLRSFDKPSHPFVDTDHKTLNEMNYNTLVFQAEALWGSLNKAYNNSYAISLNAGVVNIENETSSGYFQTGPKANEAEKLFASKQRGAVLSFSDIIKEDQIKAVAAKENDLSLRMEIRGAASSFAEVFSKNGRSYNQKVAKVYSEQLDKVFPQTKHINIDSTDVFMNGMSRMLRDENTLFHYVFENEEVLNSMANHFAGVKSGWHQENEEGKHSFFWGLKDKGKGIVSARSSVYTYDREEIVQGLEDKKILPRTALYFVYNFMEVGMQSMGGTAQAPYLTELKKRMLGFMDEMDSKIESGEFPPCPVDRDNRQKRYDKIAEMPTHLSVGGLSVAANDMNDLFSFSDYLKGEDVPEIDTHKISVKCALHATKPTLVTHKCMREENTFKVGAEEITVPRIYLGGDNKNGIITQYPSSVWKPRL